MHPPQLGSGRAEFAAGVSLPPGLCSSALQLNLFCWAELRWGGRRDFQGKDTNEAGGVYMNGSLGKANMVCESRESKDAGELGRLGVRLEGPAHKGP